ncbi:MAG: beta-propeller domain-containing protein [Patescibacteria group bacterium]
MIITDFLLKAMTSLMTSSLVASLGFTPLPTVKIQVPDWPWPSEQGINTFTSCSALESQIAKAQTNRGMYMMEDLAMPTASVSQKSMVAGSAGIDEVASDYSQTNIQVQGVDEADIVKQDGTYVYHLSKNRLEVSKIRPTNRIALMSSTDMDKDMQAQDLYIQGNRLMVIGNKWENQVYPMRGVAARTNMPNIMPPWRGQSVTVAQIWDLGDKAHPKKIRTVEFDGSLSSTRLINSMVYFVMNASTPWDEPTLVPTEKDLVPAYRDSKAGTDFKPMARCGDVAYFDQQPTREYLAVASLPMSGTGEIKRNVILGSSQTVYASTDNLYAARQDYNYQPIRDSLDLSTQASERTVIYKFALKDGAIKYQSRGTVPGRLLNQFSLDETDGNLRAATTIGWAWDHEKPSTNNLYVLGSDMKARGKIEGIAPGETIYSVRFVGKRGYIVTFKKVDPFFVLDLSNPDAPTILGKLKIPGFSDYLHPMDENHIIGVGKNAVDAAEQSFAWYQGMKLAVFDVTDVNHPKEMWKTEIGDRGTDSPALNNHKAFLYSPTKQLLALPIRLAELSPDVKNNPESQGSEYGDFTFQGAYVYRLTLDKGFQLLGRITHHENDDAFLKSGYYYGSYDNDIQRVLYADDSLITLSNDRIQLHHLNDLTEQGEVKYPVVENENPTPYYGEGSSGGGVKTMMAPAPTR